MLCNFNDEDNDMEDLEVREAAEEEERIWALKVKKQKNDAKFIEELLEKNKQKDDAMPDKTPDNYIYDSLAIDELLEKNKQGIKLDVGCGSNKQPGYVGMDKRVVEGVNIVHDIENIPYPLPDDCCSVILASHLVEHICPKVFIDVMNEWWRILQADGQLLIACPHARSFGQMQDPTHCGFFSEATWSYFDPDYELYHIVYKPKPWKIVKSVWFENGNMEVIMQKRPDGDYTYEQGKCRC